MKTFSKNYLFNAKGFSLIEILISISILSMIMLTIISFTGSTQDTAIRVSAEDKELLQIETAVARMEWDISHIYSPLYFSHPTSPEGLTEEEGEVYNNLLNSYQTNSRFSMLSYDGLVIPMFKNSEKSEFMFLSLSNRRKFTDSKQSHFNWVKYSLTRDEDTLPEDQVLIAENKKEITETTYKLTRQILTENIFDSEEISWDKIKDQTLMRKVLSLKFEFWNKETQKWVDNIDLIPNGNNIVKAIRTTIEYLDPDNIKMVSIRIFRPLFPDFTPENMYKFLNKKSAVNNAPGSAVENGGEEGE